ncbi:MAG: hypothetical protein ACI8W9_001869, partial [Psychromonas sp.]
YSPSLLSALITAEGMSIRQSVLTTVHIHERARRSVFTFKIHKKSPICHFLRVFLSFTQRFNAVIFLNILSRIQISENKY